jgi:peptidoglycan-associated lipoprotein
MTRRPSASKTLLQITANSASAIGMALILTLAGCKTPSEPKPAEEPEPAPATGSEFSQGETPVVEATEEPVAVGIELGTAYFDYDRAEVRTDQRDVLRANAEILMSGGGGAIVEGHADERGSEEYNLALGERRAEAVRKYMTALGVSRSNLRVVSYGEAKPAVSGHDESTWRLNRRAEFRTQ